MNLNLVRLNVPSPVGDYRVETPIVQFSLFDADKGRLFIRTTPLAMEKYLHHQITHGINGIAASTPITFIYRHGKEPEGVKLTVVDVLDWLRKDILEQFAVAKQCLHEFNDKHRSLH